jgi:hypothetical protein
LCSTGEALTEAKNKLLVAPSGINQARSVLFGTTTSAWRCRTMNPFRDPLFYLGIFTAFAVAFFVTFVYVA